MSLLGKILAVLNVLAAVAFFSLAAMDYGKRQAWELAVFRHDLLIHGLPVDEDERDGNGNRIVDDLTPATLGAVFQGAGAPVKTQMDEVKAFQSKVIGRLSDTSVKGTPVQKLAQTLLPLARSASVRQGLVRIMSTPDDQLGKISNPELEALFGRAFVEELRKPDNGLPEKQRQLIEGQLQAQLDAAFADVNKNRSPDEKRHAIAGLLFKLCELFPDDPAAGGTRDPLESAAYKRLLAVIGLETAVQEVDGQAAVLKGLSEDVAQATEQDRAAFAATHRRVLLQLVVIAKHIDDLELLRTNQREVAAKYQAAIDTRKGEIAEMTTKVKAAQEATIVALNQQAETEKQLFDARKDLRNAAENNLTKEREIRELEKGR